jgi:hypothetical protein
VEGAGTEENQYLLGDTPVQARGQQDRGRDCDDRLGRAGDDGYGGSGESDCVAMVAPRMVATALLDGSHDGGPEMRRRWLGRAAAAALGGDGSRGGARWGRQLRRRSVGTAAAAALGGDGSQGGAG